MVNDPNESEGKNRRQFLQTAMAFAAVGIATRSDFWIGLSPSERARASARLSPDAALKELIDGNRRFVANQLTSVNRDLRTLREHTVEKQTPFAALLSCADSRVPPELVFDQSIGDVFVARVAGNIATPDVIASLEYAVAVLGVSAVLVLGHTHCGAVKAAMKAEPAPGQISSLYPYLRPAVDQSGGNVDAAVQANVQVQAKLLRSSSPVIGNAVTARTLKVATGVYDLASGRVAMS